MVAKWNEKWGDVKKGQTQLNKERTATYNEYWGLSGTEGGEDYGPRAEKVKADTEEMNKWFEQQKAAPTTPSTTTPTTTPTTTTTTSQSTPTPPLCMLGGSLAKPSQAKENLRCADP